MALRYWFWTLQTFSKKMDSGFFFLFSSFFRVSFFFFAPFSLFLLCFFFNSVSLRFWTHKDIPKKIQKFFTVSPDLPCWGSALRFSRQIFFKKPVWFLGGKANSRVLSAIRGNFCEIFENRKKVGCPCGVKKAIEGAKPKREKSGKPDSSQI